MIRPNINYEGKSKIHEDGPKYPISTVSIPEPFNFLDSEVSIHDGILMQGIIDKNIVGTSGGSIAHVCWVQKGWEETRSFMNQIQGIVNFRLVNKKQHSQLVYQILLLMQRQLRIYKRLLMMPKKK
jgi:hypothetical protein